MTTNPNKQVVLFGPSQEAYLLRDDFSDALAAGAGNNTLPVPGPGGLRVQIDTESKLSQSGGLLVISGGKAVPAQGDPGRWYPGLARVGGRMLFSKAIASFLSTSAQVGWDSDQTGATGMYSIALRSAIEIRMAYMNVVAGVMTTGVNYSICVILRTSGAFYFMKGGIYTKWTLIAMDLAAMSTPYYPSISNYNGILNFDFLRIPVTRWLPIPLASDGMGNTGATNGLGHVEGTADLGKGGANVPWAAPGTWSVAAGVTNNAPVLGGELVSNGNMETGDPPTGWSPANATLDGVADERTGGGGVQSIDVLNTVAYGRAYQAIVSAVGFYRVSGWHKLTSGVFATAAFGLQNFWLNSAVWGYFSRICLLTIVNPNLYIGTGDTVGNRVRYDDVSVKALTTSQLFRSLSLSLTPDVIAQVKVVAMADISTQAGLAIRLNNPTTPTSGIIAIFTPDSWGGVSIACWEFSGATWTQLFTAVKAYTANDMLQLIADGSSIRLIHLTTAGVPTLIGSTAVATILTGGYHGLFSTDVGNTFDNFMVYPRGTGNEYISLDRWTL
jgi:hypothetical protein